MFQGFANVWTPVESARRLRRRPLSLTVAGERVVLFRGADGRVGALLDRCPHRGVALSLGKVTGEGNLACPFHGWEFATDGACARVPLNPAARCELLGATALPARELGGLIWIYTAPGAQAPSEPHLPLGLRDEAFTRKVQMDLWRTHWTRAMENMLDMPHLPFIHRRTIGMGLRKRMRPDSEMKVRFEPTATGGVIRATLDGQDDSGYLEFNRPNNMVLHIMDSPVGRRLHLHVFCVPLGQSETRMIIVGARDFGRYNPFVHLFDEVNRYILFEDRSVIESSQPPEVPAPGEERSVASDRPTLLFRKYYHDELRGSSVEPPPRLTQLGGLTSAA